MAKTVAIRALQRGVGSMDYVDSLLLLEPEDESKNSDHNPMLLMMMMPHLCVCHQQVHKLLTKSQFQNGATVVAVVQCRKTWRTSVVGEETVFRKQGAFENFA